MKRIRPGESGHGGDATLRQRPVRITNGENDGGWTDQWEIICPACGDDLDLDFRMVSPFLQRLRGPYPSEVAGQLALRDHRTAKARPAAAKVPAVAARLGGGHVELIPAGTVAAAPTPRPAYPSDGTATAP
jgi:cell division septation protein DedD